MFELSTLADIGYSATLNSTLVLLLVGGFVIAVVAGSIAWYNSKKPAGWEDAQKPDWVPEVDKANAQKTESES